MSIKELLANFLTFNTSYDELKASLWKEGRGWPRLPDGEIEIVKAQDVICAIIMFKSGEISQVELLDWVNTLWFSDLFDYADEQCDSIASVMTELETLDEDGACYSLHDFDQMIAALKSNREYCKLGIKKTD